MSTTSRTYHKSFKPLPTRARDISDGDAVHGYSILTTDLVVFQALENDRGHSTVTSLEVDGERIRLATTSSRPLDEWIAALEPGSELRAVAATEWIAASIESAREMIREAYPKADELVAAGRARWRQGDLETTIADADELVA